MLTTFAGIWHCPSTTFLNPLQFNHVIQLKFFQDSKTNTFLSLGPSPASSHHGSDDEEENENSHDSEEEERELKTAVENMGI